MDSQPKLSTKLTHPIIFKKIRRFFKIIQKEIEKYADCSLADFYWAHRGPEILVKYLHQKELNCDIDEVYYAYKYVKRFTYFLFHCSDLFSRRKIIDNSLFVTEIDTYFDFLENLIKLQREQE